MTALYSTTGASGSDLGTAAVTASTDLLTITSHGLVDGQAVVTSAPTGGASALVTGAPYYVASATADTFQLRPSPGAPVMTFDTDGTVVVDIAEAVYTPQGMRQANGGLLYKARAASPDIGRFGARPGVLANAASSEVAISAFTLTVNDLNCVVNPTTLGTQGGPYLCAIPSTDLTVSPADGTNPRIDIAAVRVRDDADDSTGFITAEPYLITGTPAAIPTEPTVPDGELRLARIDVPASGGGNPTLTYDAPFAVAAGGILPVSAEAGLPAAVRREGMYADQADTDSLVRFSGSAWETVASAKGYQLWQQVRFTSSGSFTKASYPGLRAVRIRCQGGGGGGGSAAATGASEASCSGGGGGGEYSEKWVLASALSASETVTVGAGGAGGTGGATGTTGGSSLVGAHCTATGGAGGGGRAATTSSNAATGGLGGNGGTGDFKVRGGGGGVGVAEAGTTEMGLPGVGGGSHLGNPARASRGGAGITGDSGSLYGGGGCGAVNGPSSSARAGAAGAAGIVILDLFV